MKKAACITDSLFFNRHSGYYLFGGVVVGELGVELGLELGVELGDELVVAHA